MPEAEPDQLYHLSQASLNKARATDNPEATLKQTYEKTHELFRFLIQHKDMHTHWSKWGTASEKDLRIAKFPDQIDKLVSEGADLQAIDADKLSLLSHAIHTEDDRVVQMIFERGVQPMSESNERPSDLALITKEVSYTDSQVGPKIPENYLHGMLQLMFERGYARIAVTDASTQAGDRITRGDVRTEGEGYLCIVDTDNVVRAGTELSLSGHLDVFVPKIFEETNKIHDTYASINAGQQEPNIIPQDLIQLYANYSNSRKSILRCLGNHIDLTLQALKHVPPHVQQDYAELLSRDITALNARHVINGPAKDWGAVIRQGEGMRV